MYVATRPESGEPRRRPGQAAGARGRLVTWQTPSDSLVDSWLTVSQVADQLGVSASRVRQLAREHQVVAVRRDDLREPAVPAECLQDGGIVKGLSGTLILLADHGFDARRVDRVALHARRLAPGGRSTRCAKTAAKRCAGGRRRSSRRERSRDPGGEQPQRLADLRGLDRAVPQGRQRRRGQLGDDGLDGGERAGVAEHVLDGSDARVVDVGVAPRWREDLALVGVGHVERAGHQQGPLALADVVTARLAGDVLLTEDPEHVVAQLERLAQRDAVGRQRTEQLLGRRRLRAAPNCSGRSMVYFADL